MADGPRIVIESGAGLLDARAMWASLVGPYRLAMAQRRLVRLEGVKGVEIAKNLGASNVYLFVGVHLVPDGDGSSLSVRFGLDEELGGNALPFRLINVAGSVVSGATPALERFGQIVLPGEQLFMRADGVAESAVNQIVVSTVMF